MWDFAVPFYPPTSVCLSIVGFLYAVSPHHRHSTMLLNHHHAPPKSTVPSMCCCLHLQPHLAPGISPPHVVVLSPIWSVSEKERKQSSQNVSVSKREEEEAALINFFFHLAFNLDRNIADAGKYNNSLGCCIALTISRLSKSKSIERGKFLNYRDISPIPALTP